MSDRTDKDWYERAMANAARKAFQQAAKEADRRKRFPYEIKIQGDRYLVIKSEDDPDATWFLPVVDD